MATTEPAEAPNGADRIKPGYTREGIPSGTKQMILRRDGYRCHYCQLEGEGSYGPDGRYWHIDHKHPVSLGGTNDADNLVLACATCNLAKGATPYAEFRGDWRAVVASRMREWLGSRDRKTIRLVVRRDSERDLVLYDPELDVDLDNCEVDPAPVVLGLLRDLRMAYQLIEGCVAWVEERS